MSTPVLIVTILLGLKFVIGFVGIFLDDKEFKVSMNQTAVKMVFSSALMGALLGWAGFWK